jgi:hypothetical protein
MAPGDEDDSGGRPVLMGLGALLVVTLLVGGLVSAMALGAAKLTGIGESSGAGPAVRPSLYIPSGDPTTRPQAYPDPSGYERPSAEPSPSETFSTPPPDRSRRITLQAFPTQVSPGERINLTGVYPRGEGAVLQVQRFEGTWTDFATVSARVSGGIYNTYVLTSRSGKARFRMTDTASGRSSNPVTVTVR